MKSSTLTSITREHTSENGAYTTKQKALILQAITFWAGCCGSNYYDLGRSHSSTVVSTTRKMSCTLNRVICTPGSWQTLIVRQSPLYDKVYQ